MALLTKYGDTFIQSTPQYIAYRKWFNEAPDYARYVYYKGASLTETNTSYTLGKIVLQDAYRGEVLLFQRRISKNPLFDPFEYIAVRRRKAPRKLVPNKLTRVEAA